MENIDKVIAKLMVKRTKLMLNRFDSEFKQIIANDLNAFKSAANQLANINGKSQMKLA